MDCLQLLCFQPLDPDGVRIFGFSEYLAALALIVVAWTIAERRYRFHLQTARWPVRRIAFYVVFVVGLLCLLTDLWRASSWPVPVGNLITPAAWQALLGLAFLAAFMAWATTAFLRPPVFNRGNAQRFIDVTFDAVTQGDRTEIVQVADALRPSAGAIVKLAAAEVGRKNSSSPTPAIELLHIMADPTFCSVAVTSTPGTLFHLFTALGRHPAAAPAAATLAGAVLRSAILERGSFLHRETADYQSGLAAGSQHLTRCLYGDIELLDRMRLLLWVTKKETWTSTEWTAYFRAAIAAIKSYAKADYPRSSHTVRDIFNTLSFAGEHLYKLNGNPSVSYHTDEMEVVRSQLQFVADVAEILDEGNVSVTSWATLDDQRANPLQELAQIMVRSLYDAASVTEPINTSWWIQHNTVWTGVFGHGESKSPAMTEIRERAARIVWAHIRDLEYHPGYVGARLLGICINIGAVAGRGRRKGSACASEQALLRLVHGWVQRNFDWLYRVNSDLATTGLNELITYRPRTRSLRKKWEANAFRPKPTYTDRTLNGPPAGSNKDELAPGSREIRTHEVRSRRRTVPTHFHS